MYRAGVVNPSSLDRASNNHNRTIIEPRRRVIPSRTSHPNPIGAFHHITVPIVTRIEHPDRLKTIYIPKVCRAGLVYHDRVPSDVQKRAVRQPSPASAE